MTTSGSLAYLWAELSGLVAPAMFVALVAGLVAWFFRHRRRRYRARMRGMADRSHGDGTHTFAFKITNCQCPECRPMT